MPAVPKPTRQPKPRKHLKSKKRIKPKYDPIPNHIREKVNERDKAICRGCGRAGTELHHIKFRSQGGKHTVDNLVTLCNQCHRLAHSYNKFRRCWEEWIKRNS